MPSESMEVRMGQKLIGNISSPYCKVLSTCKLLQGSYAVSFTVALTISPLNSLEANFMYDWYGKHLIGCSIRRNEECF